MNLQRQRQRRALNPGEIAGRVIPGDCAVGHCDQQRVGALGVEPIGDLLVHPRRRGGFGRGE